MQCSNYSKRLITGSLCAPLCDSSEIKIEGCLRTGTKLHVLRANWNGTEMILKIPNPLESHSFSWQLEHLSHKFISDDFQMTKDEIIGYVSEDDQIVNFLIYRKPDQVRSKLMHTK